MAVLVGPSHFVGFDGVAVVPAGGFRDALGVVADRRRLRRGPAAASDADRPRATPAAHAREHSLEMQLPFLQRVAPRAAIVPLVMGYQTAETADALA